MDRDPYEVLGVPVHADADAIAAAYRDLARRHHPDVSRAVDAERRMAEINAAWAILRDPARRANHDRSRPGVPVRPSATAHRPSPTGGRHAGTREAGASPGIPAWRLGPDGEGAAGPPPGPRRGTVLPFGRHIGWSIGEVARVDAGYLVWLAERREGAPFRDEIARTIGELFPRAGTKASPEQPARRRRRSPFR